MNFLSGLRWDMAAAKAYVGAAIAAWPPGISDFIIRLIEAGIGWDIPVSFEQIIGKGVAAAIGFIAVYFTSNDLRVVKVEDVK